MAAYEAAETQARAGNTAAAIDRLQILGAIRFPPALGLLAQISPDGEDRAMWARLAGKGRDAAGRPVLDDMLENGQTAAVKAGRVRAATDEAKIPTCLAQEWAVEDAGPASMKIGPVAVKIETGLDPRLIDIIKNRFPIILRAAYWETQEGRLFLSGLRRVDIGGGDRYARFVDWLPGEEGRAMRLSVGTILDDGPTFTARAMVLSAQRAVYDRLANRRMVDPVVRSVGGFRVFTSIYPDIKAKPFLDSLHSALEMAKDLPASVRPALEVVDEIHYNPPSKHFLKFGPPDGAVAYYDHSISRPGRRVIFVRRDMRWSSHADLLLSIVHEGVHATQHAEAERRRTADPNDAYAALWYLKDTSDPAYKKRIRFECEALIAEIKTADALGLDPHVIEVSPYLDLCSDAQKALVSWKDRRFQQNLDAYNNQ